MAKGKSVRAKVKVIKGEGVIPADFPSHLHQLISLFQYSLSDYPNLLSPEELESLCITIYDVMSGRGRKYHTVDHIFGISQGATPCLSLAIIFHDLVYLQVDHRIHPRLIGILPEFHFADYTSVILPQIIPNSSDPSLSIVAEVFGFQSEQTLTPYNGANEFLCALLAYRLFGGRLNSWDLLKIIASIELTIAFRSKNDAGEDPIQQLEKRVRKVSQVLGLNKNSRDFQSLMAEAVDVANRDLMSFSYRDPGKFLNSTWDLILEGNPVFKSPTHSTKQYREALLKVEKFFAGLDPNAIYYYVPGLPASREKISAQMKRARMNLAIAAEYIQSKILTVSLLESIAHLTGGDVPIVLFMGEMATASEDLAPLRMEEFLDQTIEKLPENETNPQVLSLLIHGLTKSPEFDLKYSFLSSYLYPRLSLEERKIHLAQAKEMFDAKISHLDFLKGFKSEVRDTILQALTKMAWTRIDRLRALMSQLA